MAYFIPPSNYFSWIAGIRIHAGCEVDRPGSKVEHSGAQVLHPGWQVEHSGFEVEYSGWQVEHSGFKVVYSGFKVEHSGFEVVYSGFEVEYSGFEVEYSGFEVVWSGSVLQRSTLTGGLPPLAERKSYAFPAVSLKISGGYDATGCFEYREQRPPFTPPR